MADVAIPREELNPKEKRKFWEDHVHAWEYSGLTQAEYCWQNNLKNHRWWYWRKRIFHPSETGWSHTIICDISLKNFLWPRPSRTIKI